MKRSISIVVAAVVALMLALCMAGCSSSSQNYTPETKAAKVTVASSDLVTAGTLTVGVNAGNPPLAGQTSDYVGIDVDVAAAMADAMGLKLKIIDVKSDPVTALEKGTVDLVMGLDATQTYENKLTLSKTYLQTGVALFSTKASAEVPTATSNSKFSAQASSVSAWDITSQFGAASLTSTTDLTSAFSALKEGTVDFAVADAVVGTYAAHTSGLSVYITAMVTAPGGYCAGVKADKTNLNTAVTEALKLVTDNGTVNLVQKKWLGTTLSLSTLKVTATTMAAATTTTTGEQTQTTDTASTEGTDTAGTEGAAAE